MSISWEESIWQKWGMIRQLCKSSINHKIMYCIVDKSSPIDFWLDKDSGYCKASQVANLCQPSAANQLSGVPTPLPNHIVTWPVVLLSSTHDVGQVVKINTADLCTTLEWFHAVRMVFLGDSFSNLTYGSLWKYILKWCIWLLNIQNSGICWLLEFDDYHHEPPLQNNRENGVILAPKLHSLSPVSGTI